jgi:hypothetical protein
MPSCEKVDSGPNLIFSCEVGSIMENFDLDGFSNDTLNKFEVLQVIVESGGRGPLKLIPPDICRLRNLKVNINHQLFIS